MNLLHTFRKTWNILQTEVNIIKLISWKGLKLCDLASWTNCLYANCEERRWHWKCFELCNANKWRGNIKHVDTDKQPTVSVRPTSLSVFTVNIHFVKGLLDVSVTLQSPLTIQRVTQETLSFIMCLFYLRFTIRLRRKNDSFIPHDSFSQPAHYFPPLIFTRFTTSFSETFWMTYDWFILVDGARGSVVGWGTMLQAGRSWVQFPMR
jgi:hypothetical protein